MAVEGVGRPESPDVGKAWSKWLGLVMVARGISQWGCTAVVVEVVVEVPVHRAQSGSRGTAWCRWLGFRGPLGREALLVVAARCGGSCGDGQPY
jgi:hypothetical protein